MQVSKTFPASEKIDIEIMVREMKFFEKVHKESYMQFITSKISNKKKMNLLLIFQQFHSSRHHRFLSYERIALINQGFIYLLRKAFSVLINCYH